MKALVFATVFFLLAGCTFPSAYTVGRDFDSSLVKQIVKGKTTGSELITMFGQPVTKTVLSANEEKWIYSYTSGEAKAKNLIYTIKVESEGKVKTLDVLLRDGVVLNYTYSEGPVTGYTVNSRTSSQKKDSSPQ